MMSMTPRETRPRQSSDNRYKHVAAAKAPPIDCQRPTGMPTRNPTTDNAQPTVNPTTTPTATETQVPRGLRDPALLSSSTVGPPISGRRPDAKSLRTGHPATRMSKSTLTASLKGCPKGLTSHRASCVGLGACRDWVENTG